MMSNALKYSLFMYWILIIVLSFNVQVPGQSEDTKAFMEENISFERYVFPTGNFPDYKWENESVVEKYMGKLPLKAKFFNKDFQEVKRAENTGRYGAYLETISPSGFIIKRYITLFCTNAYFDDYSLNVPVQMKMIKEYGIQEKNWSRYSANLERFSFGSLKMFPLKNPDAAVFLAGLSEMDSIISFDTPRIRDRQWWITMINKIQGKNSEHHLKHFKSISDITILDSTATLLDNQEKIEEIRTLCREWIDKGGSPNVTLIVHDGKIIFHEAFGCGPEGNLLTKESRLWMASITKLLTGVLMMQFVDQQIIDLDAPVSDYLSDLNGSKAITVRELFTHTTGLHFAGEWASDWNYALENQVGHILSSIIPEKSFSYNRVGYALAGKIMEKISGKAVPNLFHNNLFSYLNMKSAYSDNTYGGLYCTAYDLAKLGQVLLNKGSWKGYSLFSEKTFWEMLPVDLPNSNRKWGIGTMPMNECGLSPSAFGHSAASGSIFKIDPENNLIIISAMNYPGEFHKQFECSLIKKSLSLIRKN